MKSLCSILIMLSLCACNPVRGFLESEFTLSPESRLPVWYSKLPEDYSRDDIKVTIQYWSPLFDVDDTVFCVTNKYGFVIFRKTGRTIDNPRYHEWAQKKLSERLYPSFNNITIDGITEIIQHKKMEPIFYVSNEQEFSELLESSP